LRPALSLPLMVVANKATTVKHATIILMGVERGMIERRKSQTVSKSCEEVGFGKDMKKFVLVKI
jgi:hypothetical protein